MKFAYKFSNLLGAVYRKGDIIFSPDGSSVISPVGNRITIYDLKNNKSYTLPVESRYNYKSLDLSPNGALLIAINEVGDAHIISMISKMIIHKYKFKRRVKCVKFSPDGKHFAVCKEHNVFIFNAPSLQTGEYNPFIMERVFHAAMDDTTFVDWSYDSKLIAVASKDMTTKIYSLEKYANFRYINLGGHSASIVACFFEKKNYDLTTIGKNGTLCLWECTINPEDLMPLEPSAPKKGKRTDSDEEDDVDIEKAIEKTDKQEKAYERNLERSQSSPERDVKGTESEKGIKQLRYTKLCRHYLTDNIKKSEKKVVLSAAAYHNTNILVVGFTNGSFCLYEMPDVNMIHSLSISHQRISSIAINSTGDWIALGCSSAGQLLVWEWQSETYAMKQQGHSNNINCIAYSPDGQYIVTGGEDGKVKLWNTINGFCSITFQEHASTITGVTFSHNRKFIVSSSLDGTVRAYDLARYRNFRTLTSPRPVQFSCVALDSSDEFLAAGGQDFFEIYLWSVKLGTLLEILSGHEGPVSSLAFSPNPASTELVSISWDKTLKIWNAIESDSTHETIQLTADGLYVTYKPNGEEVAVATLDGQISFFHCKTATQIGSIEGRNDLGSGKSKFDLISAKTSLQGKAFTTLCYSADGTCILAGGQSKNICIYNVKEYLLVKKFVVTQNKSLDAVNDFVDKRNLTEFGSLALIEKRGRKDGGNVMLRLPGVKSGDMASRKVKPEIRVYSLQFSPTGQAWAAATTEGLLLYSLDAGLMFDPFQLELGITPETVKKTLNEKEYTRALLMAVRLNEKLLIKCVIENIPCSDIDLTVSDLSDIYVERVLKFIASELEFSRHIHFYLLWIESILTKHGARINSALQMPILLMLQKSMQKKYDDLSKICDFNQYTMSYLEKIGAKKAEKAICNKVQMAVDDESEQSSVEEMQIDYNV